MKSDEQDQPMDNSDAEIDPFTAPLPKPNPSSEGAAQIPRPRKPSINEDKQDRYSPEERPKKR